MPTQLSVLFKSRGEVGAYLTARKIKKRLGGGVNNRRHSNGEREFCNVSAHKMYLMLQSI